MNLIVKIQSTSSQPTFYTNNTAPKTEIFVMTERKKDVSLADGFTKTYHNHPPSAIDPSNNKLPNPLHVLIIGASRGIGAGIAYAYAQAGAAHLVLAARASSSQELATVAQKAKALNPSVPITCLPVDITSSESVAELVQKVKEEIGTLDILILNSGYSGPVVLKVDQGDPQDFKDVFDVNVQGTYLVAHHFIPLLRESNGAKTFIAVNSFAALITRGHIANTAYCISKLAQARLLEYIAEQYGSEGILAIAVHPGAVMTEMAKETAPESMMPCKSPGTDYKAYLLINLDLIDDAGLCGAFCVWLAHEKRMWLNGRLISATWDIDELLEKRGKIEDQDLLKIGFRVGDASAAGAR
jgi:NAD(P)-dependent dehydrogenase (short-subunit alcohol dehydrogenase family)